MKVDPRDISSAAAQKESELEGYFFVLLNVARKKQAHGSCSITPVEWRILNDCLDQINYRYADFYALLSFAVFYPMRNRAARSFFRRYRLPLYLSLVGYDCGLRATTQYPAITCWNSLCMFDSDVGDLARTMHCPENFYEVVDRNRMTNPSQPLSFFDWLGDTILFTAESLLLQKLFSYTFEGSCWKEALTENKELSSLVINTRWFKWRVLDAKLTYEQERVIYEIDTSLFPSFGFQRNMRRSYGCRRLIMDHASFGGRLWYGANFALMRLFGSGASSK